jgi:hypothetical protein
LLEIEPLNIDRARKLIKEKCHESPPDWIQSAKWFRCLLDTEDFIALLVFNGGRPLSGWQEYSNGSYNIVDIAIGLRDYQGTTPDLVAGKRRVLEYEKRMQMGEFPQALCLARTGAKGRITLFETNRRAVALCLFHFVENKGPYRPIEGILGQTEKRLPIQSQ